MLKDTVVLYAIFVDSKQTKPWKGYDIQTTLDSINKATCWIEDQAQKAGIDVHIKVEYPVGNGGKIPIKGELYRRSFSGLLTEKGISYVDKWANRIAAKAHQTLPKEQSPEVTTLNRPKDRERLIARLRDLHRSEGVALMFFVNNYYQQDISATIYASTRSPLNPMEYAVVSYKEPGTIAHEFLHLFGAIDLYRWNHRDFLDTYFSKAVMVNPHQDLNFMEMSEISQYLVGWTKKLDMCNTIILRDLGFYSTTPKHLWPWKRWGWFSGRSTETIWDVKT